jgi:heme-degrading monooxygenase HmoA
MIARIWSAETTTTHAPAYAAHLRSRVLPAIRSVDGYAGALLLERPTSDAVEVLVITFWQSADAVRSFAGADVEGAVVADEAAALLTRFDRRVRHFEVAVKDDG